VPAAAAPQTLEQSESMLHCDVQLPAPPAPVAVVVLPPLPVVAPPPSPVPVLPPLPAPPLPVAVLVEPWAPVPPVAVASVSLPEAQAAKKAALEKVMATTERLACFTGLWRHYTSDVPYTTGA
jgi:hypothetical protein